MSSRNMASPHAKLHPAEYLTARCIEKDPLLKPYRSIIARRLRKIRDMEAQLTQNTMSLMDFASGHEYFGLHFTGGRWVFREWAPNAEAIFIIGEMSGWREMDEYRLYPTGTYGVWEIRLPENTLRHQALYRLRIHWPGGAGDRIPAWARRVVQDPVTEIFNAQVWRPETPYAWKNRKPSHDLNGLLVYEAHVGMAQEYEGIGGFTEFRQKILPRIVDAGYNTLQLMAIQEHPYYGSFGYHVSSLFAVSSRFGTPDEFKALIDAAHEAGLLVIMDMVHSHAVKNEVEGLSRFDGTPYQYFHDGPRGDHQAWDSRCFDYSKPQVLHFLLSNCRFWLDEYRVDGFRFDGITSMLYLDHGLERAFTSYDDYYNANVDEDALVYLALANRVIHGTHALEITIAEDISGLPCLAAPENGGGFGFDFRFAMGVPDFWINLIKNYPDEHWPLGELWFELNNRRLDEKTISYCESHDQALVGDQTLLFRLIGEDIYHHMNIRDVSLNVDRGMALHKLIRLITLAAAGNGYLNFMGNEFGHPEWIDFPREGNGWSYHFARRQWSLADNPLLKYQFLARFDRDMIHLVRSRLLMGTGPACLLHDHNDDKVLAFIRCGLIFVFNFHPAHSHVDYRISAPPGKYHLILCSDDSAYGGHDRVEKNQEHFTLYDANRAISSDYLSLYLPSRTALVLKKDEENPVAPALA